MDERLKFIAPLLDGEKMAGLCREFGISRKVASTPEGCLKNGCVAPARRELKLIEEFER